MHSRGKNGIEKCIAEGRTDSFLNDLRFESARKYAVYNGISTVDHWGNKIEMSKVFYLNFDKKINGEIYNITFKFLNGGTHLIVHTPKQSIEAAKKFVENFPAILGEKL